MLRRIVMNKKTAIRCLTGIMILAGIAVIADAEMLRIAGYNKAPYMMEDVLLPGFCAEVFQEAARRAGYEVDYNLLPNKRLIQEFRDNRIDGEPCCSALWRKEDEAISVYSVPYYQTENVVFVRKESGIVGENSHSKTGLSIFSRAVLQDFKGKTLGGGLGYIYTDGFQEEFEKGNIKREDTRSAELNILKLEKKRLDGIITDRVEGWYLIRKLGMNPADFDIAYSFQSKSLLCVRLHKSKASAIPKLNESLKKMNEDGTMGSIMEKYGLNH